MTFSTRERRLLPLCALAVLSAGLLFAPGAAQAATAGTVVAWGCGNGGDLGQCDVPSGLSGVTAVAGGEARALLARDSPTQVVTAASMSVMGEGLNPSAAR